MRRPLRTTALAIAAMACSLAMAGAGPAQACAESPDDPCLHDPDATFVRGTAFVDRAGDGGARGADDPAVGGLLVWVDLDDDSTYDRGEPAARTQEDGSYEIEVDVARTDALPAPPKVRIRPEGRTCTFPDPCRYEAPFERGVAHEDADFGLVSAAVVRGTVWEDADEDGRHDAGVETLAAGATMYIDEDGDDERDLGEPYAGTGHDSQTRIEIPPRLLNRTLHLRLEEPRGWSCTAPRTCEDVLAPLRSGEYRDFGEWTVAMPIVVFVHGFLGSEIECRTQGKLWVNLPRAKLLGMRLADDGRTNLPAAAGGDDCTVSARPNGRLIREVAGADIYGEAEDHYRSLTRPERYGAIAWDWRKDPVSQVDALDRYIDSLRCPHDPTCAHPLTDKVVLVAHSQGGLLSRAYIDDPAHAAKVRRLVTVGTPTWGSPKAIFPSIAGVETPLSSGMDALLDNDDLKVIARNFAGGIALLPSPAYGAWLAVPQWRRDGLDAAGVAEFLDATGNNGLLARQAAQHHQRIWDHYANGSLNGVDYEVVAGKGIPTITDVHLQYGLNERVVVGFGDGDQTVPLRSAVFDAPADKVHYVCGQSHVPLTASVPTTLMIDRFILRGAKPHDPEEGTDCPVDGTIIEITESDGLFDFDLTPPAGLEGAAATSATGAKASASAAAGATPLRIAGLTPEQAEARGLADVLRFGRQTYVVTDDRKPVTVELTAKAATITTRSLDGETEGPERRYGPVSGAVSVRTGGQAVVSKGSAALKPAAADRTAPKTRATVRRLSRGRVRVTLKARDASKVTTYLLTGEQRRAYRGPVTLSAAAAKRTRYASVDLWGNAERPRRLPAVRAR